MLSRLPRRIGCTSRRGRRRRGRLRTDFSLPNWRNWIGMRAPRMCPRKELPNPRGRGSGPPLLVGRVGTKRGGGDPEEKPPVPLRQKPRSLRTQCDARERHRWRVRWRIPVRSRSKIPWRSRRRWPRPIPRRRVLRREHRRSKTWLRSRNYRPLAGRQR